MGHCIRKWTSVSTLDCWEVSADLLEVPAGTGGCLVPCVVDGEQYE